MKHLGILATTPEGAALCYRAFCQDGSRRLGPREHPDVTLDNIALARSLPAWEAGDPASVRATLATSVTRLARAGADFFACPDNTALAARYLAERIRCAVFLAATGAGDGLRPVMAGPVMAGPVMAGRVMAGPVMADREQADSAEQDPNREWAGRAYREICRSAGVAQAADRCVD